MAKEINNTNRLLKVLRSAFHHINEDYFNSELPEVEVTISRTRGAYGHFTCGKIWYSGADVRHEINVNPEYTDRPIEEIITTLIHECCHLYASQKGIKDTSNNGVYHNKRFKDIAETKGHIKIEQVPVYGWTKSSPTEETIDFCIRYGYEDIQTNCGMKFPFPFGGGSTGGASIGGTPTTPTTSGKQSTRRWVCPCCGTIIRSTKAVNVVCGDCGETFVESNK